MPTTQALQVFYGTLPLIAALAAIWFREQLLLKDIIERLGRVEKTIGDWMPKIERRLTTLETRAGVILHD